MLKQLRQEQAGFDRYAYWRLPMPHFAHTPAQ